MEQEYSEFVMTGEAARTIRRSEDYVRELEAKGVLRAKRVNGIRLFLREDVARLAAELADRPERRSAR